MERIQILDQLSALADPIRSRLLRVLEGRELTVSELCTVLGSPQSTISRHLKTLADGDWVRVRRDGTRRLYRLVLEDLEGHARQLWSLTRDQVVATPAAEEDARRLEPVIARRRDRSREFFAGAATDWDRLRDELFGERLPTWSLLGLLPRDWTVADLGCGTGAVACALAPFVRRVVAVDAEPRMLDAARERLAGTTNVDLRRGDLEAVPIDDGQADAVTLILVLHHLPDPMSLFAEVARVLKPGGRLLVLDMLRHDREEYRVRMGHVWLGFSERQLRRWLGDCGMSVEAFHPTAPDPAAKGPPLFAASAVSRDRTT